jgi:xylulokinase
MVSTGTAEVVEVASGTPVLDDALRQGNISVYQHVVPGLYLAMTLNHSGGLLLRWFRDTLGRWEIEQAARVGQDPYDLILDGAPTGPTSLFVLPHFAGSGTPWLDTSSKGALLGLSFATSHAEIAKAILEGLCFELRVNIDLLRGAGVDVSELHAVGGGARSPLWLQLKADICQTPLRVPGVTDAACLGAALLAGVGAGVYADLQTATEQTVKLSRRVLPRSEFVAAYNARYKLYQNIYPMLRDLHHKM